MKNKVLVIILLVVIIIGVILIINNNAKENETQQLETNNSINANIINNNDQNYINAIENDTQIQKDSNIISIEEFEEE